MTVTRETSFGRVVVREATAQERAAYGVAHVAEELLAGDLRPAQRSDLLDAAERARPGEMVVRQRVLAVDRAHGRILLEADPRVLPARVRLGGRPMPIDAWLSAARAWMLAVDEQAGGSDLGRPHRWIVDVDQLGMRDDGRLVFGHGRLDSVTDLLWYDDWSERDVPPSTRSLVQWPAREASHDRAAVKELALALLELLTGALPLHDVDAAIAMERWVRGAWDVKAPPGAEALVRVLARGLSFDPAHRQPHVTVLCDELAAAWRGAPLAPPPSAPSAPREPPPRVEEAAVQAIAPLVRVGWGMKVLSELATDRLFARPEVSVWLEGPELEPRVARWVERAVAAVRAEADGGAGATCARLDRAERALEARGIVLRQGYGASRRAGMMLLADEVSEMRARGQAVHGMAFFDVPAIEDAIEMGVLEVLYAAVGGDPTEAVAVGEQVALAMRAEGLTVVWSGARADPLRVEGVDWCAPLTQGPTKLVL